MLRTVSTLSIALALLLGSAAFAQEGPAGNRGGQRGGEQRGGERGQRMEPEQMRQRAAERMREQLQISEEEWQVLQPRIDAVTSAQRDLRGGGGGAWGGGRRGGGEAQQPQGALASASQELRQTLSNENATEQEITQRLEAYRAARKAAEEALETARNELRELLTPRQEAQLVIMNVLE